MIRRTTLKSPLEIGVRNQWQSKNVPRYGSDNEIYTLNIKFQAVQVNVPLFLVKSSKYYISHSNKVNWSCSLVPQNISSTYVCHFMFYAQTWLFTKLYMYSDVFCIPFPHSERQEMSIITLLNTINERNTKSTLGLCDVLCILQTTAKRLVRKLVYWLRIVVNSNPSLYKRLIDGLKQTNNDKMTRPPTTIKRPALNCAKGQIETHQWHFESSPHS